MSTFEDREKERSRKTYAPDHHRLLPQSPDAERGVLSSMLIGGPALVEEAAALLVPEHFFVPSLQTIFKHLMDMQRTGQPTDFITLTARLRDCEVLEECGGAAYVTDLFNFLPTAANWKYYAEILREKFVLRRIIEIATEFAGRAYEDQDDVHGILEEFQTDVVEVGSFGADSEALRKVDKTDVIGRLSYIEERYHKRGKIGGLTTGFADLDRTLDGLQPKTPIVLAGRPGMGKTAIGMNIAMHVSIELGQPVAFFSAEMPREQLVDRVLFCHAKISLKRIRDGFMKEADFPRLQEAATKLAASNLWIDDTPGLTIAQLRSRLRRAVVRHKCKLAVIDYVQILKGSSKRSRDNRQLELAEIMQGIRESAKQLGIPIIILAQLNRTAEDRPQSRPSMADLKECGAIEEEASIVGLLYRPAYYAKTDAKRQEIADKYKVDIAEIDTIAELEIAKHRNGGVGTIQLRFFGEFTRFEGVTEKHYSNNPEERQGGAQ